MTCREMPKLVDHSGDGIRSSAVCDEAVDYIDRLEPVWQVRDYFRSGEVTRRKGQVPARAAETKSIVFGQRRAHCDAICSVSICLWIAVGRQKTRLYLGLEVPDVLCSKRVLTSPKDRHQEPMTPKKTSRACVHV
jgi:hypothetical protein